MTTDIYNYIKSLNFDNGFNLIKEIASMINEKVEQEKFLKLNPYENINPYRINVNLKDTRETCNFGEVFYNTLVKYPKENEERFANSLSYHDRLQYDKFHN